MSVVEPAVPPLAGGRMWARGPRALERGTLLVMCTSLSVELYTAVSTWLSVGGAAREGEPIGAVVAVALMAAALLSARRSPFVGLGLAAASPLSSAVLGWDPIATWSVACFAALWLTLRGMPALVTSVALGGANWLAASLYADALPPTFFAVASIAGGTAVLLAAVGSAVIGHQKYWSSLEQRTREATAGRQTAVERSVAEERVRIARDLHDSVGHRIAVMSMRLGAAEVHLPAGADATRADLVALREDVRSVLAETQQILKVLRVGSGEAAVDPTPGFERITELVDTYKAAGLRIEDHLDVADVTLPQDVSTAAYRITQESLTNAQRYGTGAASLTVTVTIDGTVTIEVANVRRTDRRPGGGGNGLVGMRERAESAGGRLDAGTDGRLFWVRAELPGRPAPLPQAS